MAKKKTPKASDVTAYVVVDAWTFDKLAAGGKSPITAGAFDSYVFSRKEDAVAEIRDMLIGFDKGGTDVGAYLFEVTGVAGYALDVVELDVAEKKE